MISRKLLGAAALGLFATVASAAYPERDITGTIMGGAGGAMDVVSRAIQPHAEAALGKKIVMVNKPGGTGAIATNFVNNAPADGYNLLFGAENPQLHKVLGLAQLVDHHHITGQRCTGSRQAGAARLKGCVVRHAMGQIKRPL